MDRVLGQARLRGHLASIPTCINSVFRSGTAVGAVVFATKQRKMAPNFSV